MLKKFVVPFVKRFEHKFSQIQKLLFCFTKTDIKIC